MKTLLKFSFLGKVRGEEPLDIPHVCSIADSRERQRNDDTV